MEVDPATLEAADRNFALAWDAIVERSPRPGRTEIDSVLVLSSGEPVPLFNPAFVLTPVTDPRKTVARIAAHYAELGLPFALYCRDEVSPGVSEAGSALGLVEHWRPPLMVLDPIPATTPPCPPGLTVRHLEPDQLDGYLSVLADGFGMPIVLAQRMLGRALVELPEFTGILGLSDGVPVAVSGVFLTEGIAGIYNVATLPDHRGHGCGAAVTWAAVAAGRDLGATRSILQSSEAGEPVYRRMGFHTSTRYRQFEGPPED